MLAAKLILAVLSLCDVVVRRSNGASSGSAEQVLDYVITEEQPVGSAVADLVTDARLRQTLHDAVLETLHFNVFHGPYKDLFSVDSPSGIVRVRQVVDRDVICHKRPTCVIPLDVAIIRPNQHFRVFKLSLTVTDINDNTPVFQPASVTLRVPENASPGSVYDLPSAVDRDYGLHDVQSYTMTSNATERFRLHVTGTGNSDVQLVVTGELDHETRPVYTGTVTAVDGGNPPKSGSLHVTILIQDANDNVPVFDRPSYNKTVGEDFPINRALLTVRATDADKGPNGQIVYSLSDQTETEFGHIFAVDATSGALTLRQSLDFELASDYSLLVAASDRGQSATSVYARVMLAVEDRNDNSPTIRVNALNEAGQAEVDENLPARSFVAHIAVTDLDSGPGGQVQCELLGAEGLFSLETLVRSGSSAGTAEYKLVTSTVLDREQRHEYQLTVTCHDAGVPALSRSRDLVVRVADVNDNHPAFDRKSYTVGVREDAEVGLPLLRLTATDRDAGDNGRVGFTLCQDNPSALVDVSVDTGWLTTAAALDYETIQRVEVCITAVDGGRPTQHSSTATVTVNIVDINDCPPRFMQSAYTFGTYENQPPDTEIGRLVAVDPDTPPHDRFVFAVVAETPPIGAFSVDRLSGRLATARRLDRELTRVHHVVVAATDVAEPLLSTSVNVTVFVADRNDNAPVVSFPRPGNDTVEVSRYAPVGYVISRVFADDADFSDNARLSYHIITGSSQPSASSYFDVDPDLGAISVVGDLRQADLARYELVLAVTDAGVPAQSAFVTLTVDVVGTAWSEPQAMDEDGRGRQSSVGRVFSQHRLMLAVLAVVTVILVCLLVMAIVCVKCHQRRYVANKRTPMPPCETDKNLRKNLIIENVKRTNDSSNDVTMTSEMTSLRTDPAYSRPGHQRSMTPSGCDAEIQALTQTPARSTPNSRAATLALPFYNRIHSPHTATSFYTLDERNHGVVRPLVSHHYNQHHQQQVMMRHHDDHDDGDDEDVEHDQQVLPAGPCSPSESDSTSGCSSAAASNSDRDGSPRRRVTQSRRSHVHQSSPSADLGAPVAAAGAPSCCSCTGDEEGSMRSGDRQANVSRGVGYCCTVQPLNVPERPATPPPLPPEGRLASPTPRVGVWSTVDSSEPSRDELVLAAPRLMASSDRRSPRPQPPPPPPRRTSLKRDRNHQT